MIFLVSYPVQSFSAVLNRIAFFYLGKTRPQITEKLKKE